MQIDAGTWCSGSRAGPPNLGFVYFTEPYAPHARALLAALRERWPGVAWVGSVGSACVPRRGIQRRTGPGADAGQPACGRFEVFSGVRKLQHIDAWTALVHADPPRPNWTS
jgi:hypothetical protein